MLVQPLIFLKHFKFNQLVYPLLSISELIHHALRFTKHSLLLNLQRPHLQYRSVRTLVTED